jgi:hypothetical protein
MIRRIYIANVNKKQNIVDKVPEITIPGQKSDEGKQLIY